MGRPYGEEKAGSVQGIERKHVWLEVGEEIAERLDTSVGR